MYLHDARPGLVTAEQPSALTSGYRRQPHHRRLVWRHFATADLPVALADRWYRAGF